jgi:CDP-diacylglycerol--glycerol-3-phosphate 3-phosphatidyltransferase
MNRSSILARTPDLITIARLLSAPVLAWFAYNHMHTAFAALLLPALFSDVVDGWLARKLGVTSDVGALLDSIADILLMAVMLYAIWPLHPYVYRDHGWAIIAVVILLALMHLASLLKFGRLASFHTRLIRAGIFVFSIFSVVLFLFGFVPWLLYLAGFVCTLGALEHFAILALLPEWKANIHGGLPEVLRLRRERKRQNGGPGPAR